MAEFLIPFLMGCCVGIAPWHWLARRTRRLLDEIKAANAQSIEGPSVPVEENPE